MWWLSCFYIFDVVEPDSSFCILVTILTICIISRQVPQGTTAIEVIEMFELTPCVGSQPAHGWLRWGCRKRTLLATDSTERPISNNSIIKALEMGLPVIFVLGKKSGMGGSGVAWSVDQTLPAPKLSTVSKDINIGGVLKNDFPRLNKRVCTIFCI